MVTATPTVSRLTGDELWQLVADVPDPELPMVGIADLGILRRAQVVDGRPVVTLTPTYSGCPAMTEIARAVAGRLEAAGVPDAQVRFSLTPPWSSDDITPAGRAALRDTGIAPPSGERAVGAVTLGMPTMRLAPPCPRCGSRRTEQTAHFGPTACRSLHRCLDCAEPFEHMKAI